MSVATDYSNLNTSTLLSKANASGSSGATTQEGFMRLLTTQLCNQNPLNPMQDIDFTAQLAQLQSLEEQIAMTESMSALRLDTQLQAGTSMIGKYVSGADANGTEATGLVTRVVQKDGGVHVQLANEQLVPVANIKNVWDNAGAMFNDIGASGNVIGMWVEAGYDSASQPIRGIVEKVVVEDGAVRLKLYGGETVGWEQVRELRAPTEDEVWYTLPDALREKVEAAQGMVNRGVTGVNGKGEEVSGIVAGAELDGSKVYLILYNTERIGLDDVKGESREPTVEDVRNSLKGYYVGGLDADGNEVSGIVAGADEDATGTYVVLENGSRVYFDAITELRRATDDDVDGDDGDIAEVEVEEAVA